MGYLKGTMAALQPTAIPGSAEAAATASIDATRQATALGMAGDVLNGIGSAEMALYQRQVYSNNARSLRQASKDAGTAGDYAVFQRQLETTRTVGAQRAAYAANGVDLSSGTPGQVQDATEIIGAMDAATIRFNAMRDAYNYGVQADNAQGMSRMYGMAARNAVVGAGLQTYNTYLGGAASVADKWAGYIRSGALEEKGAPSRVIVDMPGSSEAPLQPQVNRQVSGSDFIPPPIFRARAR